MNEDGEDYDWPSEEAQEKEKQTLGHHGTERDVQDEYCGMGTAQLGRRLMRLQGTRPKAQQPVSLTMAQKR
jgi:hypothetical protein